MSHYATAWAFEQRNLSPSEKLVLLALADRHNPDNGCFPSQEKIAIDCNMSRRSVQNQISSLRKKGLIVIHRLRFDKDTGFPVNRYYFPFDDGF